MAGTTQFPVGVDAFPDIGPNTPEDAPGAEHDVVHANVHAALQAMQAKIGVNASSDPASLDARMAAAEADLQAHVDASDPHPQYTTAAEAAAAAPVQAVNAQTGLVVLAAADVGAIAASAKGVANGVAPLGADGKLDSAYIPTAVLGQVEFKGTWDASAGAPTATPDTGWYYIVTVAGTTNLSGIIDWNVGDWAVYTGSAWSKVDNTDAISSWNGRAGAVVPQSGDYTPAMVGAEPAIASGTTAHYWRGDKSWRDFATDVRAAVLTGLSTVTAAAIAATDTVLDALGKLQAQITAHVGAGGAVHANATSSAAGFLSATDKAKLDAIDAGTYAATVTPVANTAAVTLANINYQRVGSVVSVMGTLNVTPTAASTTTQVRVSLPVAVDLVANDDLHGLCTTGTGAAGFVRGEPTSNEALVQFTPPNVALQGVRFVFMFRLP